MTTIVDGSVRIQISSESHPVAPGWFGEVSVIAQYLQHLSMLATIEEQVSDRNE